MPDDDVPAVPELPDMSGLPGMGDIGGIFDSLQKVQDARSQTYEGHAGGGAVVIRATGDLDFESVTISPEVVDPSDVEIRKNGKIVAGGDTDVRLE